MDRALTRAVYPRYRLRKRAVSLRRSARAERLFAVLDGVTMGETTEDQPDLNKPLSRFNAPHWAMRYGIAGALKGDARWAVLDALFTFLPNVRPGREKIEQMTGLSSSSVKRAIRELKRLGLISYAENTGGKGYANKYAIADIRRRDVVDAILKRVHNEPLRRKRAHNKPVHNEPVRGREPVLYDPKGVHYEPSNGVTMTPEVLNRSAQEKFLRAGAVPGSENALRLRSDYAEQHDRLSKEYGHAYLYWDVQDEIENGASLEEVEKSALEWYVAYNGGDPDGPFDDLGCTIVEHFDVIRFMCAKKGITVELTKDARNNSAICAAAQEIVDAQNKLQNLKDELAASQKLAA